MGKLTKPFPVTRGSIDCQHSKGRIEKGGGKIQGVQSPVMSELCHS